QTAFQGCIECLLQLRDGFARPGQLEMAQSLLDQAFMGHANVTMDAFTSGDVAEAVDEPFLVEKIDGAALLLGVEPSDALRAGKSDLGDLTEVVRGCLGDSTQRRSAEETRQLLDLRDPQSGGLQGDECVDVDVMTIPMGVPETGAKLPRAGQDLLETPGLLLANADQVVEAPCPLDQLRGLLLGEPYDRAGQILNLAFACRRGMSLDVGHLEHFAELGMLVPITIQRETFPGGESHDEAAPESIAELLGIGSLWRDSGNCLARKIIAPGDGRHATTKMRHVSSFCGPGDQATVEPGRYSLIIDDRNPERPESESGDGDYCLSAP